MWVTQNTKQIKYAGDVSLLIKGGSDMAGLKETISSALSVASVLGFVSTGFF